MVLYNKYMYGRIIITDVLMGKLLLWLVEVEKLSIILLQKLLESFNRENSSI